MVRKTKLFLAHMWLALRRELHDFDLTQEPEGQRRARQRLLAVEQQIAEALNKAADEVIKKADDPKGPK